MPASIPLIFAKVGAVTAKVQVHRPSWKDMHRYYPNENIASKDFYPMVGKKYVELVINNPLNYENTCAARMSYALNRSGLKLPVGPDGGSLYGDDGFNYWLRVAQLRKKLESHFGKADIEIKHAFIKGSPSNEAIGLRLTNAQNYIAKIKPKRGIVVFEVSGWQGATGHFTLWDGKDLLYVGPPGSHNDPSSFEYYFWFLRIVENKVLAQTTRVLFWELK